jgi:transcriptional regulator of acetoin/glycerol metabolism
VPKSRYTPTSSEVEALIAKTVDLAKKRDEIEADYKALLTRLTDPDGAYKVPVAHMAEQLGVERKTIYRHTGRSMT